MNKATPLPRAMPQIVWRAGLDLNPLDPADPSRVDWLESLVWPEQTQRFTNLRAALRTTGAHVPRNAKAICSETASCSCAASVTLVVFHRAVLAYVAGRSASSSGHCPSPQPSFCHLEADQISNSTPISIILSCGILK